MTIDIAAFRTQFKQTKAELLTQFAKVAPPPRRPAGCWATWPNWSIAPCTICGTPFPYRKVPPWWQWGYGRGELFPHSDIDVLILVPQSLADSGDDTAISAVEGFISACWDIGLEIGSSVRTVTECGQEAAGDVTIQTSLLEARFLCGSKMRFSDLMRVTAQKMDAQDFLTAKLLEMRQRHTKYEDTPYSLEPNCKESPVACATCRWCCGWPEPPIWAKLV